jgi:hypothetical protein
MKMTTKKLLTPAEVWSAKLDSNGRRVAQWNQWITSRRFDAAIVASALVLPAIAAIIVGLSLHSPALLLVGFIFLIGFGVPYYILARWFLEEEDIEDHPSATNHLSPLVLEENRVSARHM